MVHAPPTPPPLSTTEIQDAARGSTSSQNPVETQTHSNAPDQYQQRFHLIVEAVSRSDYFALIRIAEEIDLTTVGDRQSGRLFVIAPLVLAYLILDQTPAARYALARLPEFHADLPLSKLLASLVTVTINRSYPKVYAIAASVIDLVSQPEFAIEELRLVLTKLTVVFMDRFRMRTFELLSKAYSSLPLALAGNYLGASAEAIIAEATRNGWTYNSTTQILEPKTFTRAQGPTGLSSLSTFAFIADSVGRLEA